jgi:hypothetical protein
MKTGFSLLEILHREKPVLITGMGLQCNNNKWKIAPNFCGFLIKADLYVSKMQACIGLNGFISKEF